MELGGLTVDYRELKKVTLPLYAVPRSIVTRPEEFSVPLEACHCVLSLAHASLS